MNVLKPEKKATLVTLLKNNISQREISRKAKIDRKTIRKYGRQFDIIPSPDKDNFSPSAEMVATGQDKDHIQNSPPRPPMIPVDTQKIGTVPYIVISGIDICSFGSPTVEKKSIPPKSSKLISARCMALVPLLMPLVLMSKFSYNAIPAKSDWHRCGFEKNLAERLKGLKIPFLLSKALVVVG